MSHRSSMLEEQFFKTYRTMHLLPGAKLLRPGFHKFARRAAARRGIGAGPVEIDLFFGERMVVILPEIISEALYTYGMFDETVTWMLMQAVKTGDTVLDIGAHFGYMSLLLQHLAGASGRVVSFEPTPSTYAVLARNIGNTPQIKALNLAAGDSRSHIEIADFGTRYSAWNTLASNGRMSMPGHLSGQPVAVDVVPADDICVELGLEPDFIKIDAENFEDKVIKGLSRTIDACRPAILMESGSPQSLAGAQELVRSGYRLRVCEQPGSMMDWTGDIEQANEQFKDILFVPEG